MTYYTSLGHKVDETTLAPSYSFRQRTIGYANNDGRWVADRVAPLVWRAGVLHALGESKVVGVFDTMADANAACDADLLAWQATAHTMRAVR